MYATIASVNTKLSLTGGTMSGNIDMSNSLVRGLGAPSENEDAANKLYVDDLVATKQPLFDYLGTGTGTTAVTINDFKGGTATFTQVVNKKSSQYFRINSDQITSATTKIIVTLVYDGAGYPIIASQKLALGRVDILVVNPDILTTGGTNTDVSIDIQYQIVG